MSILCATSVLLALAGLGVVALWLALGLATPLLIAAPALGAGSMVSGLAAAIIALRRQAV